MNLLTQSELETLRSLVSMALENRVSGINELTNEHREELYVIFAKLASKLAEPETAPQAEPETASEPEPQESWPAGRRLISS